MAQRAPKWHMAEPNSATLPAIRVPVHVRTALEHRAAALRAQYPGIGISVADAVREALIRGLERDEEDDAERP